eukprot:TRINITY_DN104206_c0_g1_i1.p1 TRINITY_DN104206_c0_g1~~TRINITY_DN104206_c0_g1_i1.p1  ORF type:complete len:103 (-),score=4.38 TRINITY_DN104206_c0_g1_i1:98-406(-)
MDSLDKHPSTYKREAFSNVIRSLGLYRLNFFVTMHKISNTINSRCLYMHSCVCEYISTCIHMLRLESSYMSPPCSCAEEIFKILISCPRNSNYNASILPELD